YTPDGVRYWAALAKPGTDTAFDEQQMKIGKRLSTKLLNACRFTLQFDGSDPYSIEEVVLPLDRSLLAFVSRAIIRATEELEAFDYAAALQAVERSFWSFCDFYIELSKSRLYNIDRGESYQSARAALLTSTDLFLRAFAPYLPFSTEQAWDSWQGSSVHLAPWPKPPAISAKDGPADYEAVVSALRAVRAAKSAAQLSVGAEIPQLEIVGPQSLLGRLERARADLQAAARCEKLTLVPAEVDELSASLGSRLVIG
ncbi:MAG: class I tRNA ligase family protein, partial [Candidatus Dormibacteraceae bacterium]